jgi:putative ABC transport system ATP-binding protein
MLEMHGISKIYRTDLIETHALRDFSLKVGDGEFVAVTGPSGSGKTTFMNVAGLLETFDTGTYKLDGQDVSRLTDEARSKLRNEKIGFIFQSFNLIPDLDIFDNVDVPLRYRGLAKKDREQRIKSALEVVGLSSRMHHMPSQLSGGQQQRAAIARALAGDRPHRGRPDLGPEALRAARRSRAGARARRPRGDVAGLRRRECSAITSSSRSGTSSGTPA